MLWETPHHTWPRNCPSSEEQCWNDPNLMSIFGMSIQYSKLVRKVEPVQLKLLTSLKFSVSGALAHDRYSTSIKISDYDRS